MSFRIRRILVAIRDESRAPLGALRKAAALARANGASIELFHAVNDPEALDALRRGYVKGLDAREVSNTVQQRSQKKLARLAALKELEGLKVSWTAAWDFPSHEAIVRRALATKADLVIASIQPKTTGSRLLLANTDWELIRHCPCAVLIAKTPRRWRRPAIVAAIDPFHAHEKPAALDRQILQAGKYLARELRGALHALHAYMPLTIIAPAPAGQAMAVVLPPEVERIHAAQMKRVFDRVTAAAGISPRRRHLEMGITRDELSRVVRQTGAELAVMGAVSRSGLKRIFIGSTAEHAIDHLDCDVLIVKPRGFRTNVPKRASQAWLAG
ncbi:MAG: universal stress protein [Gammaproteobacteria bacterium]